MAAAPKFDAQVHAARVMAVASGSEQAVALWMANADLHCAVCKGAGSRLKYVPPRLAVCNCVLREVFRACFTRYRYVESCATITAVDWGYVELTNGAGAGQRRQSARRMFERRQQDYAADFYLVSKRHLSEPDWKLFRIYMLSGVDWKKCAREMGMKRGNVFHAIYRIQRTLGRVFMDLRPYALFPLDEYFGLVNCQDRAI